MQQILTEQEYKPKFQQLSKGINDTRFPVLFISDWLELSKQIIIAESKEWLNTQLQIEADLEKTPPVFSNKNDLDNALIEDAFDLREKIKEEWDTIVIATPTGIDPDEDTKLEIKKEQYFEEVVYDRAWEVKALIETIIESGNQPITLFADLEDQFEELTKAKDKDACRKLRALTMKLEKCLPSSFEILKPIVRTPNIRLTHEVTKPQ